MMQTHNSNKAPNIKRQVAIPLALAFSMTAAGLFFPLTAAAQNNQPAPPPGNNVVDKASNDFHNRGPARPLPPQQKPPQIQPPQQQPSHIERTIAYEDFCGVYADRSHKFSDNGLVALFGDKGHEAVLNKNQIDTLIDKFREYKSHLKHEGKSAPEWLTTTIAELKKAQDKIDYYEDHKTKARNLDDIQTKFRPPQPNSGPRGARPPESCHHK